MERPLVTIKQARRRGNIKVVIILSTTTSLQQQQSILHNIQFPNQLNSESNLVFASN
jgi:hypothetical protein